MKSTISEHINFRHNLNRHLINHPLEYSKLTSNVGRRGSQPESPDQA